MTDTHKVPTSPIGLMRQAIKRFNVMCPVKLPPSTSRKHEDISTLGRARAFEEATSALKWVGLAAALGVESLGSTHNHYGIRFFYWEELFDAFPEEPVPEWNIREWAYQWLVERASTCRGGVPTLPECFINMGYSQEEFVEDVYAADAEKAG